MKKTSLISTNGTPFNVVLPELQSTELSSYLFAFHKSGSTLMDNMVQKYCKSFGIPTFSLFNGAFDNGVPTNEIAADALACFSRQGMIYLGFRHYPGFDLDLSGLRTVLLVRDPRDMLISMYYSVAKSHVIPKNHPLFQHNRDAAASIDIDTFVLQKAGIYLHNFQLYQQKLPTELLTTYRYEDVIYEKCAWLKDIVEKLDLPVDSKLIRKTAQKFDIFPESEDQEKHIRQVHPGNYKSKLKPETIAELNIKLQEFLQYYNYV